MPEPQIAEVSFDLTPDQMQSLESLFAMLERARALGHDYHIWARILPQGIADCDLHASIKIKGALLIVVPEQPAPRRRVEQLHSPSALNFRFADGTELSVFDAEKGEQTDVHDHSHKLAA